MFYWLLHRCRHISGILVYRFPVLILLLQIIEVVSLHGLKDVSYFDYAGKGSLNRQAVHARIPFGHEKIPIWLLAVQILGWRQYHWGALLFQHTTSIEYLRIQISREIRVMMMPWVALRLRGKDWHVSWKLLYETILLYIRWRNMLNLDFTSTTFSIVVLC